MNFFKIAKKSLGQNFLIDQNIINKIIKIGEIAENKTVLEIGPGYGNLTRKIVNMKPKKILAIEKDKKLALLLKNIFKDFKNKANFLSFSIASIFFGFMFAIFLVKFP